MTHFISWLAIIRNFVFLGTALLSATAGAQTPSHVRSETCAACHTGEAQAWAGSHHAWAWKPPHQSTVLGDFDNAIFEHGGVTTRFTRDQDGFFVEAEGPSGATQLFQVRGVAGIAPLQQYLLETDAGRLQALDIAWDIDRERWYHLYPDQEARPGDGLHWTGPYKTWNARCAECHATGFKKNYDPRTRAYTSTQAEIGVGCEACHGPGEAHVAWAKAPEDYDDALSPDLTSTGFSIEFTAKSAETEIQQCVGCHSRREPLSDGNPLPGTVFHDSYRLALLRPGLYHTDGAILDEVYVYGSFLQSKMYANSVRCSDCHDPHTAGLKAKANAVCTQCHSPAGNPRFPTLRRTKYDDPGHHFHEVGSDGAQCASCHMIERVYMGIDGRRDHSFRIPRPDLSSKTGAPNACTDCHADHDARWAAAEILRRFPDANRDGPHFSQIFAVARTNPTSVAETLLEIGANGKLPGIIRASALDLLRGATEATIATAAAPLLGDADPLVRAAAIPVQRGAPPIERVQRLISIVEDPAQSVRIAAARELLDAPIAQLPPRMADALQKATGEWRASLLAKADYPEAHIAIGGAALVLRNPGAAEQAFREAVRLDPQSVDAWRMIIRILAATGDPDDVRATLDDALAANPSSELLLSLEQEFDEATGR